MSHRTTTGCPPETRHTQVEFSNNQPKEGSPETEFRKQPDRSFVCKFFSRDLRFPDGLETEMWSFESEDSGQRFPAPLVRVREGEIVHVIVEPSKGPHTIHLHGIEPDPRNDGVGHTSFEVTGSYTYQFRPQTNEAGDPNRGSAGTYFYHCHVNTVLHVQMGMFGPLIIDPASGRGRAFHDDPTGYDTRAETLMVPYEVDTRWHEMNHAAGLDGEDVGLNRFEPDHFYLLGGDLNAPPPQGGEGVSVVGEILATPPGHRPGLLRVNNGSYFPTLVRFGGGLMGELISHDGRVLRDTSRTPSPPVAALTNVLSFGTAERYDMRLRPPAGAKPGDTFPVVVDLIHWITRELVASEETVVRIIDPADPPDRSRGADPAGAARPAPAPGGRGGHSGQPVGWLVGRGRRAHHRFGRRRTPPPGARPPDDQQHPQASHGAHPRPARRDAAAAAGDPGAARAGVAAQAPPPALAAPAGVPPARRSPPVPDAPAQPQVPPGDHPRPVRAAGPPARRHDHRAHGPLRLPGEALAGYSATAPRPCRASSSARASRAAITNATCSSKSTPSSSAPSRTSSRLTAAAKRLLELLLDRLGRQPVDALAGGRRRTATRKPESSSTAKSVFSIARLARDAQEVGVRGDRRGPSRAARRARSSSAMIVRGWPCSVSSMSGWRS